MRGGEGKRDKKVDGGEKSGWKRESKKGGGRECRGVFIAARERDKWLMCDWGRVFFTVKTE